MLSFWITQVGPKSNDKYPYKKQEKTHTEEKLIGRQSRNWKLRTPNAKACWQIR